MVRGLLAARTGDSDLPYDRVVIQVLDDAETLEALLAPGAHETLVTPPLTTDHLIRTKSLPRVDRRARYDGAALRPSGSRRRWRPTARSTRAIWPATPPTCPPASRRSIRGRAWSCSRIGRPLRRVRICRQAIITRDITEHTIAVKTAMARGGRHLRGPARGRAVPHGIPHAAARQAGRAHGGPVGGGSAPRCAAARPPPSPVAPLRHVALVTGAAGAIGTGICQGLLRGRRSRGGHRPGRAAPRSLVEILGSASPGASSGCRST